MAGKKNSKRRTKADDVTIKQESEDPDPEEVSTNVSDHGLDVSSSTKKQNEEHTLSKKKCKHCEQTFLSKVKLNEHERFHRDKSVFCCSECEKEFPTENRMISHMKLHVEDKKDESSFHKCRTINQSESPKTPKKRQRNTKAEKKNSEGFHCYTCSKTFANRGNLKTHLRLHNNEKPFHCPECKKCFTTKGNMKAHLLVHTKETPYPCNVCGQKFTTHGNSKFHERTVHAKEKQHVCIVCGKEFASRGNYDVHTRAVHAKEKPYECEVCNRTFSTKGNMQIHCKIHNEERDFICTHCGRGFITKLNFNVHMNSHADTRVKNRNQPKSTLRMEAKIKLWKLKRKIPKESQDQKSKQMMEAKTKSKKEKQNKLRKSMSRTRMRGGEKSTAMRHKKTTGIGRTSRKVIIETIGGHSEVVQLTSKMADRKTRNSPDRMMAD